MGDRAEAALRTFLIADIRGYTTFTQQRGDEAGAELATRFASIAEPILKERGGTALQLRGDEVLAAFTSARQAIRAAAHLQEAFVEATVADASYPLGVGIGLDAGEAVPVDDGYRGGALNLAARLCAIAGPGEILASQEVVHLARRIEGIVESDRGPVRLKGLTEPVRVSRLTREGWDPEQDAAFQKALGGQVRTTPRSMSAICPYRGLASFQPQDADRFFGRETLVGDAVNRLDRDRVLFVIGPSGSGKSSLVRAGLIPAVKAGALEDSNQWAISLLSPRSTPNAELSYQLRRLSEETSGEGDAVMLASMSPIEARLMADTLTQRHGGLLLVIDQFEELFTITAAPEQEAFIAVLAAMTDPTDSGVRVVISLRADFYGSCAKFPWLSSRITANQVLVGPMRRSDLKRAIEEPALRSGLRLEDGLADVVLDDAGEEPASLPLVSHAMAETWRRRDGGTLTRAGYREAGGVAGSIAQTADALYEVSFDAAEQEVCRRLLLRLVTPGEGTADTRRALPITDLDRDPTPKVSHAVAADLVDARLLTVDRESYEIAHEALLASWPRLRSWIEEGRDDLRTRERIRYAAAEWESLGRDPDLLYRGTPLKVALEWAGDHGDELGPVDAEFLAAGESTAREAEAASQTASRRSRRIRRVAIASLAVFAAVAGIASVVAFSALDQARSRLGQALLTQAGGLVDEDPRAALGLAVEAMARGEEHSLDARSVLVDASLALEDAPFVPSGSPFSVGDATTVVVSPHGEVIATGSRSGSISLWSATGTPLASNVAGHAEAIEEMDFTPDGRSLVSVGDDGKILVWDVSDPSNVPPPEELGSTGQIVWGVDVSADGATAASASEDGAIHLWSLAARMQEGSVFAQLPRDALTVAFSPDGRTLAAGDGAGEVSEWKVRNGRTIVGPVSVHKSDVWEIAFAPGGNRIATASSDQSVLVWDAATLQRIEEPYEGSAEDVRGVLMGAGGQVVAGDENGRLLVTRVGASARLTSSASRQGQIVDAAWGQGVLATLGWDESVQVWTPGREATAIEIAGLPGGAYAVAASPDGARLAVGDGEGNVWVRSAETGEPQLGPIRLHEGIVWSVAFSPDGSRIATGGADGAVHVISADDGQTLASLPLADGGITSVLFVDDRVVAGGDDGMVRVWNGQTLQAELGPHSGGITAMASSPDGELAVADRAGTVRFWSVDEKRLVGEPLAADDNTVWGVAWSPDGTTLAAASDDGAVQLWNVESRTRVGDALTPNLGGATAVTFLDDGATLVSTSREDGTVRVWDVAETKAIGGPLSGHGDTPWRATALPGMRFATTAADGTVRIWDVLNEAGACDRALGPFRLQPQIPYLGDDAPVACTEDRPA